MILGLLRVAALRAAPADVRLLFWTRFLRLFGFGLLSVVLVLYLAETGIGAATIGLLLTCALLGDTVVSLFLAAWADRLGRRHVLVAGAVLMIVTALLLASSQQLLVLALAVTLGVISPSGNEAGPFLSVEQAALSGFLDAEQRTTAFAWYNLVGAAGTALGSFCSGLIVATARAAGMAGPKGYLPVLVLYGAIGLLLVLCFRRLSPDAELRRAPGAGASPAAAWGLHQSRPLVLRLSALFALDAFAGGLVVQSVMAYWLSTRYGVGPATLGAFFLAANALAGLSYLAAGWMAQRVGLIRTMVFTHLPANALLIAVPFMPGFGGAAALLLLRSAITQMDVPARQAYLMAIVAPDERSTAAGVTAVARSLGAAMSPSLAMGLVGSAAFAGVPFCLAGALKIVYDLLLYRGFVHRRPAHEQAPGR